MASIARVLPWTFVCLKPETKALLERFAKEYPPRSANAYENALQFCAFLGRRSQEFKARCPFLGDLAYCELAIVSATRCIVPKQLLLSDEQRMDSQDSLLIRLRRGAHYRRCEYDLQPFFDRSYDGTLVVPRTRVYVLAGRPLGSPVGRIFQTDEGTLEFVRGLRSWRKVRRLDLVGGAKIASILRELQALGILEVQLVDNITDDLPF
jgi:hypothetical protein